MINARCPLVLAGVPDISWAGRRTRMPVGYTLTQARSCCVKGNPRPREPGGGLLKHAFTF
jgi:hypothetical protein